MGGPSYSCLVYPTSAHMTYVTRVLADVVRVLIETQWVSSDDGDWLGLGADDQGKLVRMPLQLSSLEDGLVTLASKARHFLLKFENARDVGDPIPFVEDLTGVFRGVYCESCWITVSDTLLVVEDQGLPADGVPCTTCGRNVLLDREEHPDASVRTRIPLLPAQCYLPASCPHCGAKLDPYHLSMELTTAIDPPGPRREAAPFYRFCIWSFPVEKRYPDVERIAVDPTLLERLSAVCGVPFRSFGKLA
jgi:hypothetical protein